MRKNYNYNTTSRIAAALHWQTLILDTVDKEVPADVSLEKDVPADVTLANFDHAADANVVNIERKTTSKVVHKPRLADLEIPNTLRTEIKHFL